MTLSGGACGWLTGVLYLPNSSQQELDRRCLYGSILYCLLQTVEIGEMEDMYNMNRINLMDDVEGMY